MSPQPPQQRRLVYKSMQIEVYVPPRAYKPQPHSDAAPIDIIQQMRTIASATKGIDPKIFRLLDEAEQRLKNASDTIGEYQRLTATDYPGTLHAYIELGRVVFTA